MAQVPQTYPKFNQLPRGALGIGAVIGIAGVLTICTNCWKASAMFCVEACGIAGGLFALPVALVLYAVSSKISFYDNEESFVFKEIFGKLHEK